MKTFKFEIIETLSRIVEIENNTYEGARDELQQMYSGGEIVLDDSDFVDYEILDYED